MKKNEEYRHLDFSKLKFLEKIISTEEALRDIIPIDWNNEILLGHEKVIISNNNN